MKTKRHIGRFGHGTILASAVLILGAPAVHAQLILDGGGLALVQEGPVADFAGDPAPNNLATGKVPFGSSELGPELGIDYHFIDNLNDGAYGNAFSWIGGDVTEFFDAFAGIDLGATPIDNVQSIAFGRSNVLAGDVCGGGVCVDRHQGLYTLQYTQVPQPSMNLDLEATGDAASGWVDIGTLEYLASEGPGTNYNSTWLRHRFNFNPVSATGVRLVVPGTGLGGGTAIDEIELYDVAGPEIDPPPAPSPIEINAVAPFAIVWDQLNGEFFDEEVPPDGAIVPENFALASLGASSFSSSDLGPELGVDFHVAENINDGFYGNANSWIGGDNNPYAPVQFAGVALAEPVSVTSIAWGRDNGNDFADACGGQCTDRSQGIYTLQITQVPDPDADTADTGDSSTGWETLGTLNYRLNDDSFTSYLRHEFDVNENGNPILATGVRLLVPNTGLGAGTAIDELEVYGSIGPAGPPCDLNGDGLCNVVDIDALTAVVIAGTDDVGFDLDQNGEVNQEDRRIWVVDLMNTWFGDADLSGEFNSGDLVSVLASGTYEADIDAFWSTGDFNGDGRTNSSDLVTALADGGYEQGPRAGVQAVPEPATGALLAVGALLLTGGRRRRQSGQ